MSDQIKRGRGRPVDEAAAERRRQQWIIGALKAFAEAGYAESSLDEIANHADINRATFYHYFNTKRELLDSVFDHIAEETIAIVKDGVQLKRARTISDLEDQLRISLQRLFAALDAHPEFPRVVLKEAMRDDELEHRVVALLSSLEKIIVPAVKYYIRIGMFTEELDPEITAEVIVGTAVVVVVRDLRGDGDTVRRESADALINTVNRLFGMTVLRRNSAI